MTPDPRFARSGLLILALGAVALVIAVGRAGPPKLAPESPLAPAHAVRAPSAPPVPSPRARASRASVEVESVAVAAPPLAAVPEASGPDGSAAEATAFSSATPGALAGAAFHRIPLAAGLKGEATLILSRDTFERVGQDAPLRVGSLRCRMYRPWRSATEPEVRLTEWTRVVVVPQSGFEPLSFQITSQPSDVETGELHAYDVTVRTKDDRTWGDVVHMTDVEVLFERRADP